MTDARGASNMLLSPKPASIGLKDIDFYENKIFLIDVDS